MRLLAVLALVAGLCVPATARASAPDLAVVGFQEAYARPSLIDRSAHALATVGVDGINLAADGRAVSRVAADARRQKARAHHDHLRAELLVGNWSDALGDFSEPIAHRLLSQRANRDAVAARLGAIVRRQHWDGLSIDLESLTARDRLGLVRFLRAVRAALPGKRSLAVDVQNDTSESAYRANGYSLAAISRIVDRVELMTYDQHGPWENTPGPIGSLHWQRVGLAALLESVPRSEVDLGVAGYGYAWRPHENDTLTDAQARRLAGAHARWDTRAGEWTAHLPDGSTVWWSDARSYRLRVALAAAQHLHGLAVWSLGQSDPIT